MHNLFARQLKKYCSDPNAFLENYPDLINAIDEAYGRFDSDRLMMERSLEIASSELTEKNESLKQTIESLDFLAYSDSLTGLRNRPYFLDQLGKAIHKHREKPDHFFAVLFLDLDRFKLINDALGNTQGDKIIRQVASRMDALASSNLTISRFSGDEFAILIENIRDESEVLSFIHRIIETMKAPFQIGNHELSVTMSIGVSFSKLASLDQSDILQNADTAMSHAKKKGNGQFQIFDASMQSLAMDRIQIEAALRLALEKKEFKIYYQPIVNAKDLAVGGFEALIRWEHPEKGFISPLAFIPIAEENGMIIDIGDWVFKESAKMIQKFQEMGKDIYISVNLSFSQFQERNIPQYIENLIKEYAINPKNLYVELTESSIMKDVSKGMDMLSEIIATGARLSLDDFGTGYSSLSYLKKFPVHNMKIDQTFIKELDLSKRDRDIVNAIIAVAHSLDLTVTAEGVENISQLKLLKAFGCDRIQGYYISKPLPEEKVLEFLALPNIQH
jgi:diguanylate cyclase (GGDEF)-like protein